MGQQKEELQLFFRNQSEFEKWMMENHSKLDSLWILFAKKNSGIESLYYPQALEVSLCYGWIDGLVKSVDSEYYRQRFTPRRKNSIWSSVNRNKVEKLIEQGRMRESGFLAIEMAKNNGQWEKAYSSYKNIQVPEDFKNALIENPVAAEFFDSLDSQNRYAILFRLETSKNPQVRQKKMNEFLQKLLNKEKIINNS